MQPYIFCAICGDVQPAQEKVELGADFGVMQVARTCLCCGYGERTPMPIVVSDEPSDS